MASRAFLLLVALCAVQTSQASLWDTAVESITTALDELKNDAMSSFNNTENTFYDYVKAEVASATNNVTAAISDATAQFQQLVTNAENEGISAGECGISAATNLTNIYVQLPISLAHCYIDYLDVFNPYYEKINRDISAIFEAITQGTSQVADCSLLDPGCFTAIIANVTETLFDQQKNIWFQVAAAASTSFNLQNTIALCLEEKSTQVLLDVYKVIPATQSCIAEKKAELEASSSTTSS